MKRLIESPSQTRFESSSFIFVENPLSSSHVHSLVHFTQEGLCFLDFSVVEIG